MNDVGRILVVDDDAPVREMLADALVDVAGRVQSAGSGAEALALARADRPDVLVTDIRLGDCTGLDVIEALRRDVADLPAIVVTAYGDAKTLTEASRHRPVELMTKPLDLQHLRQTVRRELERLQNQRRFHTRLRRLRRLARRSNIRRKQADRQLGSVLSRLTAAHQSISTQMDLQKLLIEYQSHLIRSFDDDAVFEKLFRTFVSLSGPLFGAAMVCDEHAELRVVGRFGVPHPDGMRFCEELSRPIVDKLLADPVCTLLDAGENSHLFHPSIRRYLVGLSILAIPLIPARGELIGLVLLYRKGEQPFTQEDLALAEMLAPATAAAVRRND